MIAKQIWSNFIINDTDNVKAKDQATAAVNANANVCGNAGVKGKANAVVYVQVWLC